MGVMVFSRRFKRRNRRRHRLWPLLAALVRRVGLAVWFLWRMAALSAAALALGVLVGRIHTLVMESPYFLLTSIDVRGNQRLTLEEVLESAGVSGTVHLLELDLEDARKALLTNPWIREATLRKLLPNGLILSLQERSALALVSLRGLYMVDDQGAVFRRIDPGERVELPVLTGFRRESIIEKEDEARVALAVALKFLQIYQSSPLALREALSEIHYDEILGLSMILLEDGAEIRLGWPPVDELGMSHEGLIAVEAFFTDKLNRLAFLLDEIEAMGKRPIYLHIDGDKRPQRVAARLRERGDSGEGRVQEPL